MTTPTPRTDAVAIPKNCDPSDWVSADFARQLERELAAAQETRQAAEALAAQNARDAWKSATVLAHNICVQEIDRINADDGSIEAMDAISECARRIKEWAEPSPEQLAEMIAEGGGSAIAGVKK